MSGEGKTGAEEIVEFMVDHGYEHVFGLPGSQLVSIFHTLQRTDITLVPTIHESVTVAAADGYARIKGSAMALIYMLPATRTAWRTSTTRRGTIRH
jgi:thiamine pyrophosphate-dependent acetolactate synthase large subunit-like protein